MTELEMRQMIKDFNTFLEKFIKNPTEMDIKTAKFIHDNFLDLLAK